MFCSIRVSCYSCQSYCAKKYSCRSYRVKKYSCGPCAVLIYDCFLSKCKTVLGIACDMNRTIDYIALGVAKIGWLVRNLLDWLSSWNFFWVYDKIIKLYKNFVMSNSFPIKFFFLMVMLTGLWHVRHFVDLSLRNVALKFIFFVWLDMELMYKLVSYIFL